jgi:hypothetical protein
MQLSSVLLAVGEAGSAVGTVTERFEFGRLAQMTPLLWLALAAASVLLIALVVWFYLRDCVELGGAIATTLILLRMGAFLGLLWIFLLPQHRIERPVTINSRLLLTVDTSLSMATVDEGSSRRRIDEVVQALQESPLIAELRKKHDIEVVRFDSADNAVVTLAKIPGGVFAAAAASADEDDRSFYDRYWPALVITGVALLAVICLWLTPSLSVRVRAICTLPILLAGAVVLAIWSANFTDLWTQTRVDTATNGTAANGTAPNGHSTDGQPPTVTAVNWRELLAIQPARGHETRLVETLNRLVDANLTQRGIAGIVVVTDGCNTDGIDPSLVLRKAKGRGIPIYTVGVGSDKVLAHVRLTDFVVPSKAYPNDSFQFTAVIEGLGLGNQTLELELWSEDAEKEGDVKLEQKVPFSLDPNGEKVVVTGQVKPEYVGRRKFTAKVILPGGAGQKESEELTKSEIVEVVDHKTHVLLFAGGPSREYRFLRNQLQRDKSMIVDVLLQTVVNKDGVSQDANEILLEFPADKLALRKYHCIVAFDPEWKKLTPEQVELLENWVAKDAGGLVLIPGPIHTPTWIIRANADEAMGKIRALYPVRFRGEIDFGDDRAARDPRKILWKDPRPKEGVEQPLPRFLWLADTEPASRRYWDEFEGFFDCFKTESAKEGANVYAVLPDAAGLGDLPVLMADQMYGSGRVFYLGSGEMWRIRAVKEEYFETFYTKLIRHVSQGTLLRGTKRGMLLTEDEYDVGQTVFVRVRMEDAQGNELVADSISMEYVAPDEQLHQLELKGAKDKPGYFSGNFTVTLKGSYGLKVPVPDSDEVLTKDIKVRLPDRENRNTRLNKALLAQISEQTGAGEPFLGMAEATSVAAPTALVNRVKDRTEVQPMEDTPHKLWDNQWTLWVICALLCLEWIIRRLCKLA